MSRRITETIMMLFADLYRLVAAVLDWRGHLRALRGRGRYDVACIVNFESPAQLPFMGLNPGGGAVASGLRFSLHGRVGRSLLIRSSAKDLEREEGRAAARQQVRQAIARAAAEGARIVLFGAGTKRLLERSELDGLRRQHGVAFTIGDHGTAWALQQDVFRAIERGGLKPSARIVVIGPTGFLGSAVIRALRAAGYNNLVPVSSRRPRPFARLKGVQLVVACSHHRRVRLTAEVLDRIAHPAGVQVVDVCKPSNLCRRELAACTTNVERQDAGNTYNPHLRYVFAAGARQVLARLGLSTNRLFGCFSEAMAISALDHQQLKRNDWLAINDTTQALIDGLMPAQGFSTSPRCCFGVLTSSSAEPTAAVPSAVRPAAQRTAA